MKQQEKSRIGGTMLPLYKDRKAAIEIYYRQSRHVPPHVHETVELIYVADGTLAVPWNWGSAIIFTTWKKGISV